jgi:serine/threonine protein kinase
VTRWFCSTCRRMYAIEGKCPADETALRRMPTTYPALESRLDVDAQITGHIADGGMSRVFEVMLDGRDAPVAVKVLAAEFGSDEPAVERYYREARMNLLLDHSNVVDVIRYGLSPDGHHTIVMEQLAGQSLAEVLDRQGRLPWQRALHIAIELADALGHAHGRRVIHRDIKPDNIQLIGDPGPSEQVKLLDFGVAYYAADRTFSGPAPGSTGVSGTPAYMSPEQIQGLPLDGRSDLYAVGVLLFELLSGGLPFDGNDPVTMCRHQLYTKPPSLRERLAPDSDVPKALVSVVDQLMKKRRPHRLSSVGALLDVMLQILPKEAWPVRVLTPPPKGLRGGPSVPLQSVHGMPSADLLGERAEASVALLHVEVIEGDEQLLYPTAPDPALVDVFERWCQFVTKAGAWVQRPDARSARCFFGLYDLEQSPERKALMAAKCADVLDKMVGVHFDRTQEQWLLRAGLVARHFVRSEFEGPAILCDNDADEAYWLAREAEPGQLMAETDGAFALRAVRDIEPVGDLVVPPDGRLVRCWRITQREQ